MTVPISKEFVMTMEKTVFNGELGFWDYLHIAFLTLLAPKKLSPVGPARGTLYALPNGKTFIKVSPKLQEARPPPTEGPLPMPQGSVVVASEQMCHSASFELDDEFEAAIRERDAQELAARETASSPLVEEMILKTARDLTEFTTPDQERK